MPAIHEARPMQRMLAVMKAKLVLVSTVLMALLAQGCATVESEAYPAPAGNWVLYGQVENISQAARHVRGDPAGGAVAGAVIGGLIGTALGGRGFGTFVGATEGAMIGANSSQGGYDGLDFHVAVRFDDGSLRTFVYHDQLPFRRGEYVVWTPQGLGRR
jgi:outer membrane lipoprotein SlyB